MSSFTVEPKILADALAAVKPAVTVAGPVGALGGVRVTASLAGGDLTAAAADVAIRRGFPVTGCEGPVDCLVSHGELMKVSKVFAGERVELAVHCDTDGGEILVCSHDQRRVTLKTLRLEDFPVFPDTSGAPLLDADGPELAAAIERAGVFASKDRERPILCGIEVDWKDRLVLAATDSYRLCVIAAPGELQPTQPDGTGRPQPDAGNVTIGSRGLLLAAKAMRKAGTVSVLTHEDHVIVRWHSNTWVIGTVPGRYPDWRELIPDGSPNQVTIPLAELRRACDAAVALLAKGTPVRLLVNGDVTLHGRTPNGLCFQEGLNGASAQIDAEGPFEVGFEPQYLRDIARTYTSDIAVVNLRSPRHPVVFEDDTDRYALMPHHHTV